MSGSLNLLPASYADFRRTAERRLPRFLFDYIDGGAGAEVTLRRNTADWEAMQLRQKVLVDASAMDCSVELLGEKLAMPLVLAPVGMGGMTARRGEVQAKRAADKAGIPFCLSTVGICPMEEVGQVSQTPFWFQLYMLKDRGIVQEILDRAWAQGVRTLAFTIDLAVLGTRYRDIRNGMAAWIGAVGTLPLRRARLCAASGLGVGRGAARRPSRLRHHRPLRQPIEKPARLSALDRDPV